MITFKSLLLTKLAIVVLPFFFLADFEQEITYSKPQANAWTYAGKWWCVVPEASTGTNVFRLDGTTWTPVLKLLNSKSRADCWVVGEVVHILLFKGASKESYITSIQYDAATATYKLWDQRPFCTSLKLPGGAETATLTVDGAGRMWVAAAGVSDVYAWWSDAPYSIWSAPITIASGIKDDDICAITKLPRKIGIFWSNQNTRRFGFKTHSDGSSPTSWSEDEKPASQSAIDNIGAGMADDHINLVVASDGTLYGVVKTNYDSAHYPQLALTVRRPSGHWDQLYKIATHLEDGTRAIIVLNEALRKVKVVYTTKSIGGNIAYKESSIDHISFGSPQILMNGGGNAYNFASSTHQTYQHEVVILARKVDVSPFKVVGVLASDNSNALACTTTPITFKNENVQQESSNEESSSEVISKQDNGSVVEY